MHLHSTRISRGLAAPPRRRRFRVRPRRTLRVPVETGSRLLPSENDANHNTPEALKRGRWWARADGGAHPWSDVLKGRFDEGIFWSLLAIYARYKSSSKPDRGAWHLGQHLLLVVDGAALVGGHAGRVVRRDEQAVDVRGRNGEAEVVADEATPARARIPGPGARILREPAEVLPRLLRIPRELRDSPVGRDGDRPTAAVLVGLQRDVDAEVRLSHVRRENAGVVRASLPAVVEGDRDRPAGTAGHGGLELVGGDAWRVDVVVHLGRRRPCEAGVGRLRELDVHLPQRRVPVLIGEVKVAGPGRADREALGDPVAEPGVGEAGGWDNAEGGDRDEGREGLGVVAGARHEDGRGASVGRKGDQRDV